MSSARLATARADIRANIFADEAVCIGRLVRVAELSQAERSKIAADAAQVVRALRRQKQSLLSSILGEYSFTTPEGVPLMSLAEALLRVPDQRTADELIRDRISGRNWAAHFGRSSSLAVNAASLALMLSGQVLGGLAGELVRRVSQPVIRAGAKAAISAIGREFVLGRDIKEAERRAAASTRKGYLYSFDMLGEAARTEQDAQHYYSAYLDAIRSLAHDLRTQDAVNNHGISVKLSALHPRYEASQRASVVPELADRLLDLSLAARDAGIGLTVDAEEADRLDLSLDIIERVLADRRLAGWVGFGVVVQAYGKRAPFVIDWLYALADQLDRRITVRLVKGAYWDTEIKRAQVMGLDDFPVLTRKANTDVSYLACVRQLLGLRDRIFPQFATHNAHTLVAILAMAPDRSKFELQRLHGMGEDLHEYLRDREATRNRIYAPVGTHADLLAYLVRRLLENGANSSFVHQISDPDIDAEIVARDPFEFVGAHTAAANPAIASPSQIFGAGRRNSRGFDIADPVTLAKLENGLLAFATPHIWRARPIVAGGVPDGVVHRTVNPAALNDTIGEVVDATPAEVTRAVDTAIAALPGWDGNGAAARAALMLRAAELYEENTDELLALCVREAGKTLVDAIAELREAVDFLRYYASQAERAEEAGRPRGVIACISPWNFPLAIFTGQIAAALVTGNTVVAKPAEQTPLIAARAVELLHLAGIPREVLQLVLGDGPSVGAPLTADPRIAGVCFTGSIDVARSIEQQLAKTAAPDAMLIAETGGLNAMIVDSTALPEQSVRDILASAFQSAGQRCSALRILYVQKDVEHKFVGMLKGALSLLKVGNPSILATDVGPVIDEEAQENLNAYCRKMTGEGRLIARLDVPSEGHFVAPHIFRVSGIAEMEGEVFGPVLHLATFGSDELDQVIADINAKQYGLTFGLHTRIESRTDHVASRVHVGNIYVNRNQIGAVVGSQPFGGEGLSGTGPKAGGPNYLARFRRRIPAAGVPAIGASISSAAMISAPPTTERQRWANCTDRVEQLRAHLPGAAADMLDLAAKTGRGPKALPGPTGERNELYVAPLGQVVCLGPDRDALLFQSTFALAAGNAVIAIAPSATSDLSRLLGKGFPLAAYDGVVAPALVENLDVQAVAIAGDEETLRQIRQSLARRSGPIVRMITTENDPMAYALERTLCVDTTATGGNTALMTVL